MSSDGVGPPSPEELLVPRSVRGVPRGELVNASLFWYDPDRVTKPGGCCMLPNSLFEIEM